MKQLADDVFVLEGFPPYAINVYLLGDVLIDAATRLAAGGSSVGCAAERSHCTRSRMPIQIIRDRAIAICETLGIPLWCGEADADAMEKPG